MSRTEGLSWDEFLHTFSADQSPEALEFGIKYLTQRRQLACPGFARLLPPRRIPYLLFQTTTARPVPQNAADSLGLSK